MTRTLMGGLFAAAVLLPATSFAVPQRDSSSDKVQMQNTRGTFNKAIVDTKDLAGSTGSLGSGMVGGNDPGHVTGPGRTPIDNDTRGPINDVQPGRGTDDTLQSAHPKPVQ